MRLTANKREIFCTTYKRFIGTPVPGQPDSVHGDWKILKHQWDVSEEHITHLGSVILKSKYDEKIRNT